MLPKKFRYVILEDILIVGMFLKKNLTFKYL